MKKRHLFLSFILLSAMGLTVSSCSSDDGATDPQGGATTITLAKKADVAICSGDQTLYSTLANKAVANAMLDGAEVKTTQVDTGRVEVNLSVNTELARWDYIATKLSIHVRYATNVKVFIPVTAEYYCSDDNVAAVVAAHGSEKAEGAYSVKNGTSVDYTAGGHKITLNVTYADDGIYVETSGIDAETLKYFSETYGDGITFELWNYYKNSFTVDNNTTKITRESLKTFLDKSTVKFENADPYKYVNAFNGINKYTGKVYSKEIGGQLFPYTDENCTEGNELAQEFWIRSEGRYSKYYTLVTTQNEWDCIVKAPDAYKQKGTEDYDIVYMK